MGKKWYFLCGVLLLAGIGLMSCGSFLDQVTPSEVPKQTRAYLKADANDFGSFVSLHEAEQARRDVVTQHRDYLLDWEFELKKEDYLYQDAIGYLTPAIERSREMQAIIVGSEDQPFSLAWFITQAGFGGTIGLLAKNLLKRKKDYTPEEHFLDVERAKEEGREEGRNVNHEA